MYLWNHSPLAQLNTQLACLEERLEAEKRSTPQSKEAIACQARLLDLDLGQRLAYITEQKIALSWPQIRWFRAEIQRLQALFFLDPPTHRSKNCCDPSNKSVHAAHYLMRQVANGAAHVNATQDVIDQFLQHLNDQNGGTRCRSTIDELKCFKQALSAVSPETDTLHADRIQHLLTVYVAAGCFALNAYHNHCDAHDWEKAKQALSDLETAITTRSVIGPNLWITPTQQWATRTVRAKTQWVQKCIRRILLPVTRAAPEQKLNRLLKAGYVHALNKAQSWQPIEKTFTLHLRQKKGSEQTQASFTSQIVPASSMVKTLRLPFEPFQHPYHGQEGISSHSRNEAKHAVNMAYTALILNQPQAPSQTIFRAVRHGTLCPWQIKNPKERQDTSINRTKEVLAAAVAARPDTLEAVNQYLQGKRKDAIVLNACSISLMTPDRIRGGLLNYFFKNHNERQFTQEQLKTWQGVQEESNQHGAITLAMFPPGSKETVRVPIALNLCVFSFGVNPAAFNTYAPNWLGGWDQVEANNQAAMNKLIQWAEHVTHPTNTQKQACAVANILWIGKLSRQIQQLWQSKRYQAMGEEPYKIVSRIALLTYLLGGIPLFNCKSGKDRTGMLDGEAKRLASCLYLFDDLPEPDAPWDAQSSTMAAYFLLQTGNLEMQTYNTGVPGFKTGRIPAIDRMLRWKSLQIQYHGLSSTISR